MEGTGWQAACRLGQCLLTAQLLQVLGQYRRIDWLELRLSSGGEPERCGAGRY